MRAFVRRTVLFIFIGFLGLVMLVVCLNEFNKKVSKEELLDGKITTVFVGDSHVGNAINDSLIDNCINMAQNSESFYFSYFRLKRLLENNSSIKEVWLGYGYHNISSYYDQFVFGKYSNVVSSRYFYWLPVETKMELLIANRNDFFSYLKAIVKTGFQNAFSSEKTYQEGYTNDFSKTTANIKSIQRSIQYQYFEESVPNDYSSMNIRYLFGIKQLCDSFKVDLILINTPIHPSYLNLVPEKIVEKYYSVADSLHVHLVDLSDLLDKDSFFTPDGHHVSLEGSLETGMYVKDFLQKRIKY